jgi:hypothetical protein
MGEHAPWVCSTQAGRLSVRKRHGYVLSPLDRFLSLGLIYSVNSTNTLPFH